MNSKDSELADPPNVAINLEKEQKQNQEKPAGCSHYLGYMSVPENKKQMPEECLLCTQVIQCMQKKPTIKL